MLLFHNPRSHETGQGERALSPPGGAATLHVVRQCVSECSTTVRWRATARALRKRLPSRPRLNVRQAPSRSSLGWAKTGRSSSCRPGLGTGFRHDVHRLIDLLDAAAAAKATTPTVGGTSQAGMQNGMQNVASRRAVTAALCAKMAALSLEPPSRPECRPAARQGAGPARRIALCDGAGWDWQDSAASRGVRRAGAAR